MVCFDATVLLYAHCFPALASKLFGFLFSSHRSPTPTTTTDDYSSLIRNFFFVCLFVCWLLHTISPTRILSFDQSVICQPPGLPWMCDWVVQVGFLLYDGPLVFSLLLCTRRRLLPCAANALLHRLLLWFEYLSFQSEFQGLVEQGTDPRIPTGTAGNQASELFGRLLGVVVVLQVVGVGRRRK